MSNPSSTITKGQQPEVLEYATFDDIFKGYQNMVYSIAFRFTGNRDDAMEVAQESFIRIYKGLPTFRYECKVSTWVYRITVNQALMHKRSKRVFVDLPEISDDKVYFGGITNAIERLGIEDRKRYVSKALELLNPDESAILMLYYLEEQSVEEIAEITQLTQSNVKIKLFRGRNNLHEKLSAMLNVEVKSLL
ncbi:MAG: RNA polymerase sigma factor [Bacteroidales bacterium]